MEHIQRKNEPEGKKANSREKKSSFIPEHKCKRANFDYNMIYGWQYRVHFSRSHRTRIRPLLRTGWLFVCDSTCHVWYSAAHAATKPEGCPNEMHINESLLKFVDMTNGCILCKQWFLARNTIRKCFIEIEVNTSMQFDGKICIRLLICMKSFLFCQWNINKMVRKKKWIIHWMRHKMLG